jgi:hypothetical protein
MVRVQDQYLALKVKEKKANGGFLRVIVYLEDLGPEGSH